MSRLIRVAVRMYQVGFGDCFLVSFEYDGPTAPDGRTERHMLIDFGRNRRPHFGGDMLKVAKSIRERCAGRLDVIVVSHRHEDHLSGFGSKAVSEIIEACHPRLIARSWTEHPDADQDATGPAFAGPNGRYLAGLHAARSFVSQIAPGFALDGTEVGRRLKLLAATEVANKAAVDRLRDWGAAADADFLNFGVVSKIGALIPGIDVDVLGPPTPADYPDIANQSENDPEYWNLWSQRLPSALAAAEDEGGPAIAEPDPIEQDAIASHGRFSDDAPAPGAVGPVRWLTEKVRKQQVSSLLRIVRWLDEALNNTSVVLLIRAGDRRLLFPGDAQGEAWKWILEGSPDAARNRTELAQVDLYKVGHHGSRNATPKTGLYGLWTPSGGPLRPVLSLLSTREDVYGESAETDVPNPKLVAKLGEGPMRLISTLQDPTTDDGRVFFEVAAPTKGPGSFEEQP